MAGAGNPLQILQPKTLQDALAILAATPGIQIYAGGTALFPQGRPREFHLPPRTLSLQDLEEIRRILIHDRFWEMGAGVTLNQLLTQPRGYLPPLLQQALVQIGNSPLRNLATLGGNLCQSGRTGDLFPALYLLGAQVEIRSSRTASWLANHQIFEAPVFPLAPGELVTRVRLPMETWDQTFYHRVGHYRTPWEEQITLLGLVKVAGTSLKTLRLAFHLPWAGVIRNRSTEASLSGQRLPLGKPEQDQVIQGLLNECQALEKPISPFQKHLIQKLARRAMNQLKEEEGPQE